MEMFEPVRNGVVPEHRKTALSAISFNSPNRPIGWRPRSVRSNARPSFIPSITPSCSGVRNTPGINVFETIPLAPYSTAMWSDNMLRAALEMPYALSPSHTVRAHTELMCSIEPPPAASRGGGGRELRDGERSTSVHGHDLVKDIDRKVGHVVPLIGVNTRIVHDDVEPTHRGDRGVDDRARASGLRHVAGDPNRTTARRLYRATRCLDPRFVASAYSHEGSFFAEAHGYCLAYAARGAGNQGSLGSQCVHRLSSPHFMKS